MTKHWHERHAAGCKIADDASNAHVDGSLRYRKRIADGELNHRGALAEAGHKRHCAQSAAQAKFAATRDPHGEDHGPAQLLLEKMAAADSAYARDVAAANSVASSERSLASDEYRATGAHMGQI